MRVVRILLLLVTAMPMFGWVTGYTHRYTLTVQAAQITGSITGTWTGTIAGTFPWAGSSGAGFQVTHTVAGCGVFAITCPTDLIFTTTADVVLNWQFSAYTASTGAMIVHVKTPTGLQVGSQIYCYVGNPAVVAFLGGAAGTEYDANTVSAWHWPDGVTVSYKDSITANDLSLYDVCPAVVGVVDGAFQCAAGGSLYKNNPTGMPSGSADRTACAWLYPVNNGDYMALSWGNTGDSVDFTKKVFAIGVDTSGPNFRALVGYGSYNFFGTATTALNAWGHVCGVLTTGGTVTRIYLNGAKSGGDQATVGVNTSAANMVATSNLLKTFSNFFHGRIDEATIDNVARADNWIQATYNNQNAPGSFWVFGPDTTNGKRRPIWVVQP